MNSTLERDKRVMLPWGDRDVRNVMLWCKPLLKLPKPAPDIWSIISAQLVDKTDTGIHSTMLPRCPLGHQNAPIGEKNSLMEDFSDTAAQEPT